MESQIGGPMGPKTCIDPHHHPSPSPAISGRRWTRFPDPGSRGGRHQCPGAVIQRHQLQYDGAFPAPPPCKSWRPAIPMTWAARGESTISPPVIQTIVFLAEGEGPDSHPQHPGRDADPFVGLQSGTSTLSNNVNTAEELVISFGVGRGPSRSKPGSPG